MLAVIKLLCEMVTHSGKPRDNYHQLCTCAQIYRALYRLSVQVLVLRLASLLFRLNLTALISLCTMGRAQMAQKQSSDWLLGQRTQMFSRAMLEMKC